MSLHWLTIKQRISFKTLVTVFKCVHRLAPIPLQGLIIIKDTDSLLLEVKHSFPSTNFGKRAFSYYGPRQWNALPTDVRTIYNIDTFKSQSKHYLFEHFPDFNRSYKKYDT